MSQAVEVPPVALTVKLKACRLQNAIELFLVIYLKEMVGRVQLIAFNHSLKLANSAGGALVISASNSR